MLNQKNDFCWPQIVLFSYPDFISIFFKKENIKQNKESTFIRHHLYASCSLSTQKKETAKNNSIYFFYWKLNFCFHKEKGYICYHLLNKPCSYLPCLFFYQLCIASSRESKRVADLPWWMFFFQGKKQGLRCYEKQKFKTSLLNHKMKTESYRVPYFVYKKPDHFSSTELLKVQ